MTRTILLFFYARIFKKNCIIIFIFTCFFDKVLPKKVGHAFSADLLVHTALLLNIHVNFTQRPYFELLYINISIMLLKIELAICRPAQWICLGSSCLLIIRSSAARLRNTATGHEFSSAKSEYKAKIYCQVIDQIYEELQDRFCSQTNVVLGNLYRVLMNFREPVQAQVISSVTKFYSLDEEALKSELHVLGNSRDLQNVDSVQQLGNHLVHLKLESWFPILNYLIRVYLSLPVTSSTSERSFSQLKLLKDDKRSTMTEPRLRGLAIMKIEKQSLDHISPSQIVKIFVGKKTRRQKFI